MAVNMAQVARSKPSAQDAAALRRVFETVHPNSCPLSYNFHMHTVCSDGQLHPETLVQQAIAIGLQGFAITDHHTVDGYCLAKRWLDECQPVSTASDATPSLPQLWTGIEVTSQLLETEVHILGYAFDFTSSHMQPYLQRHAPKFEQAQAAQVIASIQAAGGLAILAHPVRYRRSPEELIPEAVRSGIDGVESFYAYYNPDPWRASPKQTEQVMHLSQTYNLLNTCGTDTHGRNLLQRL